MMVRDQRHNVLRVYMSVILSYSVFLQSGHLFTWRRVPEYKWPGAYYRCP